MINKVRTFRKDKGLTQEELAQILNVSRQTIISIESKRYIPSTLLALKIANCFKLNVEELFELEKTDLD
jgi:putative transcriptional regulator